MTMGRYWMRQFHVPSAVLSALSAGYIRADTAKTVKKAVVFLFLIQLVEKAQKITPHSL